MALNIKNDEAHKLAKELALLTGESMSQAVTIAIQQRLDAVRGSSSEQIAAKLLEIGTDCATRWKDPWASSDHGEMLYDELGLPK
jgi:antitoxin VapB